MAEFIAGKTIETAENVIEVTSTPDKPLPIGVHRFQLVVKDDAGNLSQPALIEVVVRDSQAPTAVIDFADLRGTPQREPVAEAGKSFGLSGARSSDVAPGKLVAYQWTLLAADISRPTPRPVPTPTPTPVRPS